MGGKGDLSSTCLTTCYSCRQHTGGKNLAACLHLIPPCAATWADNTTRRHSIAIHNTQPTGKTLLARESTPLPCLVYQGKVWARADGSNLQYGPTLVRSDSPSMKSASLPISSGSSLLPRSPRSEILRISGDSETFLIPKRPDKSELTLEMVSLKAHRHCRSKH